jgi:type II secretory pathway pseudopilin PulG
MSEKRYKGLSIFSQLLIAFMVVVVIISGLLTAVYYSFSKRQIEQQTIESLLQQFVMVRYHFNDEIRDELSSDLRMLAEPTWTISSGPPARNVRSLRVLSSGCFANRSVFSSIKTSRLWMPRAER